MEIWKAAVLGAVQGICEFLPVSSSGHLLLFERILGTDTEGADLFLGVMLHAGTLLSALLVFAPRIVQILRADRRRALLVLLATVPAALAGVFLGDAVDAVFFGGEWLWAAFLATSLLLLAASHRMRRGGLLRPLNAKKLPCGRRRAGARGHSGAVAQRHDLRRGRTLRAFARGCRRIFLSAGHPRRRGGGALRVPQSGSRRCERLRRILAEPRRRRALRRSHGLVRAALYPARCRIRQDTRLRGLSRRPLRAPAHFPLYTFLKRTHIRFSPFPA